MGGTGAWKRAAARFKHRGSCFGLAFLATLSVGSVIRGQGHPWAGSSVSSVICGLYLHQSLDDSQMTCSSCSSLESKVS